MATLTVFKFDTPAGAEEAIDILVSLQEQHLISILDAALVSWPKNKCRPRTRRATPLLGLGTLDGAFWGTLFGLTFFMPVLGSGMDASNALNGALSDVGIEDRFIYQIRSKVTEGTSALFILARDIVLERFIDTSTGSQPELITTSLRKEQESKLHNLFADHVAGAKPECV